MPCLGYCEVNEDKEHVFTWYFFLLKLIWTYLEKYSVGIFSRLVWMSKYLVDLYIWS